MNNAPIGIYDSGLGGLTVWREVRRLLPEESLLYLGDGKNCPYGSRPREEVRALADAAVAWLVEEGCKLVVVACNTATSAAIVQLREAYPDIPVIGTEPALKPAVEKYPGGRILVMATPMTIKQEKFQALKRQYDAQAEIIALPCGGLMEFVERGMLRGPEVENYLFDRLEPYLKVPVDAIVLGCTHYPFLTGAIRKLVGRQPEIMDGSHGVAMQLQRKLQEQGIESTQATISRDIKQLHLIKEPVGGGRYRYAVSAQKIKLNFAGRLQVILRESILSADRAQNLVVVKMMPGLGPAAGSAFDGMEIPAIVGTVSGDDTVLVVLRDEQSAAEFCTELTAMIK